MLEHDLAEVPGRLHLPERVGGLGEGAAAVDHRPQPGRRRPDRGADYLSLAGELLRRLSRQDLLEPLDELSVELVPAGARA